MADYADGRESSISGQEADDCTRHSTRSLRSVQLPVFFGDVEQQLLGDGTVWDRIGVVKYPTRKSFIDMQSLPSFQESHHHKDAGMESTIVMGTQPMARPDAPAGFAPVDWADVPHPPTDDDGPAMVVHVLRFHDAADGACDADRHGAVPERSGQGRPPPRRADLGLVRRRGHDHR